MAQQSNRVLIVFADKTLGGTSRSALMAGAAWRSQGFVIEFLPLLPIHEDRQELFRNCGVVLKSVEEVDWNCLRVVHLHHAAWLPELEKSIARVIDAAQAAQAQAPLISNNIFAVEDGILRQWPEQRAVGVLGLWAAYQYTAQSLAGGRHKFPHIIPNPQDTSIFSLPAREEKLQAKSRLGISQSKVILRTGSPHESKWSPHYVDLARAAANRNVILALAGAPQSLKTALESQENVVFLPLTGSDDELRTYYWAADCFAHDATRGESFGNALVEALLCGLPVIYRNRPFRDNTPWEFTRFTRFQLARTAREWISLSLAASDEEWFVRGDPRADEQFSQLEANYGLEQVGRLLSATLGEIEAAEGGGLVPSATSMEQEVPSVGDRLCIYATHNPLVATGKRLRLRYRQTWRTQRVGRTPTVTAPTTARRAGE